MSHLKEREEKICLNCGAELIDRYCHHCGQENVEPKESAGHLIAHFFSDLFHFDGKFFVTMKYLATKPGFLTEEYVNGRRVAYVNPIRMYLFVSAVFFLLFMSFFLPENSEAISVKTNPPAHADTDTLATNSVTSISINQEDDREFDYSKADTVTKFGVKLLKYGSQYRTLPEPEKKNISLVNGASTVHEYDSIQKSLPEHKRDGSIKRSLSRKILAATEFGNENPREFEHRLVANFFHSLPYMLFISLPLIALLLKLLYIRRKQFYYVSHAIFTVNYYIFVFISFLLILIFQKIEIVGELIAILLQLGIIAYLYLALLRFYKQGYFKTFVKFLLVSFFGGFLVFMLALAAGIISFLNAAELH